MANVKLGGVDGRSPSRGGLIRRIHAPMYHAIGVRTGAVRSVQTGCRNIAVARPTALRTGDGIYGNSLVFRIVIIIRHHRATRETSRRTTRGNRLTKESFGR
jgi:hypothetical protein